MRNYLVLPAMAALIGCAYTPQLARVTTDLKPSTTVIGGGARVHVTAVDERPSLVVGHRGTVDAGAELKVQGDLAQILKSAVESGLQRQDFSTGTSGASLKIEIRSLDYKVTQTVFGSPVLMEFAVKAICSSDAGQYENFYRAKAEDYVWVVATEVQNDRYVSTVVSDAVNQMINDAKLGDCLKQ